MQCENLHHDFSWFAEQLHVIEKYEEIKDNYLEDCRSNLAGKGTEAIPLEYLTKHR